MLLSLVGVLLSVVDSSLIPCLEIFDLILVLASKLPNLSHLTILSLLKKHLVLGLGGINLQSNIVKLGTKLGVVLFKLLTDVVNLVIGGIDLGLQCHAGSLDFTETRLTGLLEFALMPHGFLLELETSIQDFMSSKHSLVLLDTASVIFSNLACCSAHILLKRYKLAAPHFANTFVLLKLGSESSERLVHMLVVFKSASQRSTLLSRRFVISLSLRTPVMVVLTNILKPKLMVSMLNEFTETDQLFGSSLTVDTSFDAAVDDFDFNACLSRLKLAVQLSGQVFSCASLRNLVLDLGLLKVEALLKISNLLLKLSELGILRFIGLGASVHTSIDNLLDHLLQTIITISIAAKLLLQSLKGLKNSCGRAF
ncbi:hypothetical protein HG530_002107 [Fusarium avenaceum]|nr:hypothetical protein HG530_002107 [Fusarium avenaceum]